MKFLIKSFGGWNDPGRGQHPAEIACALVGPRGAVVWEFCSGIGPTGPYPSMDLHSASLYGVNLCSPYNKGIHIHSELDENTAGADEMYITESCMWLDGRPCVCTQQGFTDNRAIKAFACEGFDGVERVLTEIYHDHYKEPTNV